jgi:hypothetical protein
LHDFKRLYTVLSHTGGAGADDLTGGAGDDNFVYTADADIASSADSVGDEITDFSDGDSIQLDVFTNSGSDASGFFSEFGASSFKVLDNAEVTAGGNIVEGSSDLQILTGNNSGSLSLSAVIGNGEFSAGDGSYSGALSAAIDSFQGFLTGLSTTAGTTFSGTDDFLAFAKFDDGTDTYLAVAFVDVDTAGGDISASDVDIRALNLDDHDLQTSDIEFLAAAS